MFFPQRDVYTYLKHFRCDDIPTLTSPPALLNYRNVGFPLIIGFKDGQRIHCEWIGPYREAFRSFVRTLQPSDTDYTVVLTGPRKMAHNYVIEDSIASYIYVVPDSEERYCAELRERMSSRPGVGVKIESELTSADLQTHLIFEGGTADYDFEFLKNQDTPIRFGDGQVWLGDYRFAAEDIGIETAFPNPFNRQTYISMRLHDQHTDRLLNNSGVDYSIWRFESEEQPCRTILDGVFAKHADNDWKFSDSLAITYTNLSGFCPGGVCPLPASSFHKATAYEYRATVGGWTSDPAGSHLVLGNAGCRFPSIAAGPGGEVAVAWEESGDIIMATMRDGADPQIITIECDSHDSFDPQIAWNGRAYFVAYLSDQDGWYRLCGNFVDAGRPSPSVLISEMGSLDVLTPAVAAGTNGHMTVAWSVWQANQHFPRYRVFEGRTAGPVQTMQHVTEGTDGYTNAWYCDLAVASDGTIFGAWNQHYPATLGICAGNLVDPAASVTRIEADPNENENGGYPSVAVAADGRRWVIRETCWWDTYANDKPQHILAAYYDNQLNTWSTPYVVSDEKQSWLNQTPQVVASGNTLTAVWSGRVDDIDSTWGIYRSRFENDQWGQPVLISPHSVWSRAPAITAAADGAIWVCWHAGVGDAMRVQVSRLQTE